MREGLSWLTPETRRARLLWWASAVVVFSAMTAYAFRALSGTNWDVMTVLPPGPADGRELRAWDLRYAVWAVSRNARTFASFGPLFDANQCFPARHSLALGHGVFALGALAVPLLAVTSDPVALYDAILLLLAVTAPLAMYFLVTELTALPVAGIVAGLVYGFHASKIGDPDHAFLTDTGWLVLALAFLRRMFVSPGRLSPAIGFGVCTLGQIAAGIYPAAASAFVGGVVLVGLVLEQRPDRRFVRPALVALGIVVVGATALYLPYFEFSRRGLIVARGRVFLPFRAVLPGGALFVGAPALLLALLGVGAARVGSRPFGGRRFVRGAFAAGLLVALFLSTGGVFAPEPGNVALWSGGASAGVPLHPSRLYELVSAIVPGLDVGRGPAYAYGAALVCVAVLAGFGVRAAVDFAGRAGGVLVPALVAALVVGCVAVRTVVAMPSLASFRVRPDDSEIALFEAAAALGNRGPVLELPLPSGLALGRMASSSLLLSAYTQRKTSRCFASFVDSSLSSTLSSAVQRLPADDAVGELVEAGFTTILVRRAEDPVTLDRLQQSVRAGGRISPVVTSPNLSFFSIR